MQDVLPSASSNCTGAEIEGPVVLDLRRTGTFDLGNGPAKFRTVADGANCGSDGVRTNEYRKVFDDDFISSFVHVHMHDTPDGFQCTGNTHGTAAAAHAGDCQRCDAESRIWWSVHTSPTQRGRLHCTLVPLVVTTGWLIVRQR